MNSFTEFIGVIGTALILDRIYQRRSEIERHKSLVIQLGSPNNALAQDAARQLQHIHGWSKVVSIPKAYLVGADLSGTDLRLFDISGGTLTDAKLNSVPRGATSNLWKVNFSGAHLVGVDFSNAGLREAILFGAHCCYANFAGAFVKNIDFRGADLRRADLTNVLFEDENGIGIPLMDSDTVLPDGTRFDPVKGVGQLSRFIDPSGKDYYNDWLPLGNRDRNAGGRTVCPE